MLQYDGKAYIYGFLMIFKKLFEIFHCQKNRRGCKRIAGSVHCKKIKEKYKKLWPAHSAEMLLSGV